MPTNPVVSVITVVKNDAIGLSQTLESLICQEFSNFECLIIIGDSEDQTPEIAEKFAQMDARFLVIPEITKGVYGAMNDGIMAAKGGFLNFMNAGDCFYSEASLGQLLTASMREDCDLVIGGFVIDGSDFPKVFKPEHLFNFRDFAFNRNWGNHQAMMFRRKTPDKFYDTNFTIAADFKYVLEYLVNEPGLYIPSIVARIKAGGVSDTRLIAGYIEKFRIRSEMSDSKKVFWLNLFWTLAAIAKRVVKLTLIKTR